MRALISGVTGQDGYYLSQLLLSKGYEVFGLVRYTTNMKVPDGVTPVYGDITDPNTIDVVSKLEPDEIYNLAAMSHVAHSFGIPAYTMKVNAVGTIHMLEAAKRSGAKFYQASTSELFGSTPPPQNENTHFHPRSPYAVAKLAAHYSAINYRESYDMFVSTGILFNHESPKRGPEFVTQKICQGAADIYKGLKKTIELGNLEAVRDWGHAKDYVEGMWLMLQDHPDDYVLATGEGHTVRNVAEIAFEYLGMDYKKHIVTNSKYFRPAEVNALIGDASKAKKIGWEPKYTFKEIIEEMTECAIHR